MQFDVYNENCPSRVVLEIISNKWVILIIEKLATKPHRFGELKRAIGGISPKVLTTLLKKLEQFGLVLRQCFPGTVMSVEYSLTSLGESLSNICKTITQWAEENIGDLGVRSSSRM
ncbi:MAG: winged helix-turn-helix transcriptional regulator [Gammaproteobacteria bacterium]